MASNIPVIVQGNSFSLAIPLQIYIIDEGEMVLQDYTPDPTDEVSVQLKGSRRNYTYTPTIDGNVAYIDLSGNELADNYSVVVSIVKANGQRLRSFRTDQFFIVESSDDLTQDDIIAGLEENVIYLNAQAFIAGADGRGIESIVKTATAGLVDTYTITYSDNTTSTFNVTNGAAGAQGADGVGITSIEKTATVGLVDTYTITLSNGQTPTFDVTNGKDGVDLGLATIVNNLTEGGEESVLSAEMGKELGDVLVNDTKDLTSQMKAGYVMSGTANVGQTITLTETANANGHYIVLDVVAGEKVWLKGDGYAGNRQYIFMDDNNVVKEIAMWNKPTDTDWTQYTTPNGATKLVANSISATYYGVKISNTPMTTRVANLESGMTDIYTPLQLVGEYSSEDCIAGYIAQGNNGAAVSIVENSNRRYIKLDIKKGDKIRVNVVPSGVATYIVTDSNDVILYQGTKPYTPFDSVLDITRDDAAHIYCNTGYNIIVQRYTLPTQGEYNEVIDNVVSHLDMVDAENLYDGEVEIGNFGGLTIGMWTSPISVEAGEAYTCYMIMGTNKYVGFWNGDTYVSNRIIQNGVNHITVPSGCDTMRFYSMDVKRAKECYVVAGTADITAALTKKAKGYVDEYELGQLSNKINLPLADKNIAILGDSITNVGYYPAEFFRITGYKNKAVYGRDGAAWTNDEYHTDNNIKERIDALENGITWTPDIIIVALGRNDNGRSPIGDVCEALWADQTTIDARATMYNAIRYGVKRLRTLYPNAKIFLQGIQWAKIKVSSVINTEEKYRQQDNYVLQYNEVIRNAADHMGCSFINVFADGVCEDTADRYLSDGLHDNAAGGVVHGRCVAAAVLAAYKD